MKKFSEWIKIKENNSPGFAVNREQQPMRDRRYNPYSFSFGNVSPDDPENYWANKAAELPKQIGGQISAQLGSVFTKTLNANGLHPTFGANMNNPSIVDLFIKPGSSNTDFYTTRVDGIPLPSTDQATVEKTLKNHLPQAIQRARDYLIQHELGDKYDLVSRPSVVYKDIKKNNGVNYLFFQLKFRRNKD
jgi:hypothetical protein